MKFNLKVLFIAACLAGSVAAQENTEKPQKKGFWIFSFEKKPLPPRDEMRERMHSMQKLRIFDYVTVFQLENEMEAYASQAYALKTRFTERERLIIQERASLMDELEELLHQQKSGQDRSTQILRNYKKLYSNTKKMHELGMEHASDLQKLSQHIYDEYQMKIDARMSAFEQNPEELSAILIQIHDKTGGAK